MTLLKLLLLFGAPFAAQALMAVAIGARIQRQRRKENPWRSVFQLGGHTNTPRQPEARETTGIIRQSTRQ